MASDKNKVLPEPTAVRVALWRALHVLLDANPSVFVDEWGARLVGEANWQNRPDMNPDFSKPMRASIVGRARFVEDVLEQKMREGVTQYVILGAGLDTFAERRPELAAHLHVFEVDQPGPQAWKQARLAEIGFKSPANLHFVPVNFEEGASWWNALVAAGFDQKQPALFVSTGVSMYLTKETNLATFRQLAMSASGSTFLTTFMLSLDRLEPKERSVLEFVMKKARESGTPFLSLFTPEEIVALAQQAGFKQVDYVSAQELYRRYFANRADNLNAGQAEGFLMATVS